MIKLVILGTLPTMNEIVEVSKQHFVFEESVKN